MTQDIRALSDLEISHVSGGTGKGGHGTGGGNGTGGGTGGGDGLGWLRNLGGAIVDGIKGLWPF